MLLTGEGLEDYLQKITGLESDKKLALRKKYTRSAKDILNYLLGHTNKLFTSRGGFLNLDCQSEAAKKSIQKILDNITQDISLDKWIEKNFLFAYHTDPNGVFYVESPKEGDLINKNPYPTYKSILTIHDYVSNGQDLEYIIFKAVERKVNNRIEKVYRVVDDFQDAYYYINNDALIPYESEEEEHSIPTNGKVPAVIVSDIVDHNTSGKQSIIEPISELLTEYIRDTGVKSVYKKLHGFPVFFRYVTDCKRCKGTGYIDDEAEGEKDCATCSGTGKNLNKDVSDTMDFSMPESKEDAIVTPDAAGYISPSVDTWEQMTKEQQFTIDLLSMCYWNATLEKKSNETATGRFIDVQPVNDKLNVYANSIDSVKGKIIDIVGSIVYPDLYKGCIVKLGRRFLIETPDQIWEKYCSAKEKEAPVSVLNFLIDQFFYSEFQKDEMLIKQKKKEFFLEPYPHHTLSNLQGNNLTKQAQEKLLYNEWIIQADTTKEYEFLIKERDEFINEKLKQIYNETGETI